MGWKLMSNGLWKATSCYTQERDYSGAEWVELCCGLLGCADQMGDCKPGVILGLQRGKRVCWHRLEYTVKSGVVTVSKLIIIAQRQRIETHRAILGTAPDSTGARQQKDTKDIWKSGVVKAAKSFCSHSVL